MDKRYEFAGGLSRKPVACCHVDNANADAGRVWVVWATAGTGEAEVKVPSIRQRITTVQVDGTETPETKANDSLKIYLRGDTKMLPPVLVIVRAAVRYRRQGSSPAVPFDLQSFLPPFGGASDLGVWPRFQAPDECQ